MGSDSEKADIEREADQVTLTDAYALTYEKIPWYLRVPFTSGKPAPPPSKLSYEDAPLTPEASAGFWSLLTFAWMTPILSLGYSRPVEVSDLYKLQDERMAARIGSRILESFDRRRKAADAYNERLVNGDIKPGWRAVWWTLRGNSAEREHRWRTNDGQKRPSLILAMNDSVKWWFWTAGILKVISDCTTILSPLVTQAIINFATESYNAHRQYPPTKTPSIGRGIGLAFVLLGMQVIASLCQHHFFYRSMTTGALLRGGLIAAIHTRSLRLTSRARATLTNGKLVTHVGTDVSRIDFCAGYFHIVWSAPVQIIICLIEVLVNLGPSALAGFSLFLLGSPLQSWIMKRSLRIRSKSMQWTDKRIKLIQELLGGMKIIKYFAWEVPFLKRIMYLRQKEIQYIRSLVLTHGASNAIAFSFPVLATVLAFVTYSLTGHNMTSAVIFTSLSLFQLLRTPLQLLPVALSGITDAYNAVNRMYEVFIAETVDETRLTDPSLSVALEVKDAEFTWDGAPPSEDSPKKKRKRKHGRLSVAATRTFTNADVFKLRELNLSVPRGQLCAIVGPVGSGKSSLLQGLMGEMRRTSGTVTFCGSVSYCPQGAWIQNATIRENICFGRPFEPERYWKAVRDVCLLPDFAMLPHGDMTEVGEKGISLSGGQKQRLNICRAIYCDSDIQIFDDPLSALDAHVGKEVFRNVLQSSPQGKTRILVTHALHFLPYTDCIVTVMDGRIAERGTYEELVANANGAFSRWIKEFAIQEGQQDGEDEENGDIVEEVDDEEGLSGGGQCRRAGTAMMQVEERNTGAVGGDVYTTYLKAGNGKIFVPGVLVTLFLYQAANIMSSYWLIYWQEEKWPRSSGFYMGIYAGLGFAQTVIYLLTAGMFAFQAYFASRALHRMAIDRIMHAPMSFFETTPLGRAMNRFSKDTDTLDNYIGDAWSQLMQTVSQVLGAVILISIIFPFFLVPVGVISICYLYYSMFYRASAREFQRLEAILRSSVFSHFSESLTGLVTIRAYGESARFRVINENRIDYENRAYWLTIANQRWLAIRLDMLGALLIFLVALLAVIARFTISPSKTGISLSYILLVQQSFNQIVRLGSTLENEMNSAERIAYYAKHVEQEAPHEIPEHKPPRSWPTHGSIEFNDVHLTYRPGLPPVLKGFNMSVAPGEKVGIVGRTGAGKSSIMVALYRIVELAAGTITIDGIDITKLGLTDLRQAVAIIPQDALLFSGSLRSNLDPFELHDDARLWDALQRSYLVDQPKEGDLTFYPDGNSLGKDTHTPANRFSLDTVIDDDGSNLSVGQRSLISLARALVKDAKLLVLDEATASVDYETDKKIQETISREFHDRTILCIAHRLHTILSCDRICVLDAGCIAELDTPANLYAQDGIFRSMCDESAISLNDIQNAAQNRGLPTHLS